MAKIYTEDGWVNWPYIVSRGCAFNMVVGARGVGKTYGLCKYLIESGNRFIYLRRLKSQLEQCATETGNPFKKLNADLERDIKPKNSMGGVIYSDNGELVALGVALSTVANVRGFDYSDYNYIVFDEAIASAGERPIPHEFEAFLNFYETVNRNRELTGGDPVQCFLLGNANRLTNPYFAGWGFMRTALNMLRGGQMVWNNADNTRLMVLLQDSRISKAKAGTALYKNASSDFMSMALDNAFRTDGTQIKSMPLREYNHIVSVGDIGIYKHKYRDDYYVSFTTGKDRFYDAYGMGLRMFQNDFFDLRLAYMVDKKVWFESYEAELIFRDMFDLT